jgi:NADPH2:quinone reductase
MKAIQVRQNGGPEQLVYTDVPNPTPGANDVVMRVEASGVNFIDVYHRTGLYKTELPLVPGVEAAGVVESIGSEVIDWQPGDRVAYAMKPGSYAELVSVPAASLVALPEGIDARTGASLMLQGMTAHYLVKSTFPLKPGDTALVHAAAGATGMLVVQLAKLAGARVIGTVSTEAKAETARAAGADEIINYATEDFAKRARELTAGRGVDVVYDSVGASTFEKSLESLRIRGMLVSFGNASGAVPKFEPALLAQKGSLFLTRPSLAQYVATREELTWRAAEIFEAVQSGQLKVTIDRIYPLSEARQAHADLESRKTSGKLLLLPQ